MTFILGWKNKGSVFITADSVITSEGINLPGNQDELTSFGELQIEKSVKTVSERSLKIYNLSKKLILTFCGVVKEGIGLIELIDKKIRLENNKSLRHIVEETLEESSPIEVGLIFGFMEKDIPVLLSYNCQKEHQLTEHTHFVHSGSVNDMFPIIIKKFFSLIIDTKLRDDDILTSACALLQSFGLKYYLLKDGVGGFFSGVFINSNGVNWLKDIAYSLYSSNNINLGNPHLITACFRDNMLCIKSPYRQTSIYGNTVNIDGHENAEKWKSKHLDKINSKLNKVDVDYYVFLDIHKSIITIIPKENNLKKDYFRLKVLTERKLEFAIRGDLLNVLLTEHPPGKPPTADNDYYFMFNWQ